MDRAMPARSAHLVSERAFVPRILGVKPPLPGILARWDTTLDLEVVEREILVPGLAAEFDGLTVAHVADLHFDTRGRRGAFFREVVDQVNAWSADVVVFTGDFVTRGKMIPASVELHAQMRGRLATLAVLGNHDYWTNPHRVRQECRASGIRLLHNRRWTIERAGRRLTFAGTDQPWGGTRSPLDRLVRPRQGEAVVLLSHTPDNARPAARAGASLMLSGHNHGGQICLPVIGPLVVPSRHGLRYTAGVYDVGPDMVAHVSRGVGVSSVRDGFRTLCPPEVVLLRLRSPFCDVAVPARDSVLARALTPRPSMQASVSRIAGKSA
jgi:predicted MPP superfamily phosphohydrolase